jgi:integrase
MFLCWSSCWKIEYEFDLRMPKIAKEKSVLEIKRLTQPGLYAVGGVAGLQLLISKHGYRSWVLRVLIGTKRRDFGLGGYPDTTLAQAKVRAREIKDKIHQGIDPIAEKKASRSALLTHQAKQITFEAAAIECHKAKSPEFSNVKHKAQWISTLKKYAFPVIGNLPVADIDLPHLLKILQPIWHTKTETASRVRQRIEAVMTWATVSKYRSGENPARWEGNLKEVLPNAAKIINVKHFPALHWKEIGQFMAELRKREGISALALEFAILTAARSSEVRGMTPDEVDFNTSIWTVPAERMKAKKEHKIPLSKDAIKILNNVIKDTRQKYTFPALNGGQLSNMAMLAVVRRMEVNAVPHGFRSSFKDWARSCTNFPDEVSELALAHVNSDGTRAAYARDQLLPMRKQMMSDWAKYCSTIPKSSKFVPHRKK